jgi:hypothetical protein
MSLVQFKDEDPEIALRRELAIGLQAEQIMNREVKEPKLGGFSDYLAMANGGKAKKLKSKKGKAK